MMAGFGKSNAKSTQGKTVPSVNKQRLDTPEKGTHTPQTTADMPLIKKKGDGSSYIEHCPSMDFKYPGLRCVHSEPPIFEIDGFLPSELCDEYVQRAQDKGYMIKSQTFSTYAEVKRTSSTWYMPYESVPEFLNLANRLTGFPIECFEEPQIVRYELGQQFSWHYDSIPKSMQDESGNRIATLLIYLNDVKTGGATTFKDLGVQVQPVKGKAALFFPCFKDGKPDERTMHAGQVAMDTKWIAQV
jgi:hypothetical protein